MSSGAKRAKSSSREAGGEGGRATTRKPDPIGRPAALNAILLTRLRDDIVSGVFALGEKLSEDQISRHYGVTRAPVRPTPTSIDFTRVLARSALNL